MFVYALSQLDRDVFLLQQGLFLTIYPVSRQVDTTDMQEVTCITPTLCIISALQ